MQRHMQAAVELGTASGACNACVIVDPESGAM